MAEKPERFPDRAIKIEEVGKAGEYSVKVTAFPAIRVEERRPIWGDRTVTVHVKAQPDYLRPGCVYAGQLEFVDNPRGGAPVKRMSFMFQGTNEGWQALPNMDDERSKYPPKHGLKPWPDAPTSSQASEGVPAARKESPKIPIMDELHAIGEIVNTLRVELGEGVDPRTMDTCLMEVFHHGGVERMAAFQGKPAQEEERPAEDALPLDSEIAY